MNFDKALDTTGQDITGVVTTGSYDNFSAEEEAFVEGVESTQDYYNDIIFELREDLISSLEQEKASLLQEWLVVDASPRDDYLSGVETGVREMFELAIKAIKETDNEAKF